MPMLCAKEASRRVYSVYTVLQALQEWHRAKDGSKIRRLLVGDWRE